MPLYEYQCKKCGHRFEKILKFSDKPVKKCPECGGLIEQVISAPAVQFKGSGWYVTDYGKNTSHGSSSKEGDSSSAKKDDKAKSEEKSRSEDKAKSSDEKSKSEEKSKPESAKKKGDK